MFRQLILTSNQRELRFALSTTMVASNATLPGEIDIGESGTLLGLELDLSAAPEIAKHLADLETSGPPLFSVDGDSLYLPIMPGGVDQTRSAALTVIAGLDANGNLVEFVIPRRGAGYEISYPSGNR